MAIRVTSRLSANNMARIATALNDDISVLSTVPVTSEVMELTSFIMREMISPELRDS